MEIIEAIRNRRSIRSYKSDPVPRKVLEEILDTCRWTTSASNTQPWEFAILGGKKMEELKARLVEKIKMSWDSSTLTFADINPDVPRPEAGWPEPYLHRVLELRGRIDSYQFPAGTEQLDERRAGYMLHGGRLYDAPNAIILYTESSMCPMALFDTGAIAQAICLAALNYGLGTCIMGMVVTWPDILRELLDIPDSALIVMGIAIGYPDNEARVNNFVRTREPLDTFTHWYGV
jgi:nitroreductase